MKARSPASQRGIRNGDVRRVRGDTLVRTLRKIYGPDFAAGLPGTAKLNDLLVTKSGKVLIPSPAKSSTTVDSWSRAFKK
jgi:hypothetical protein